VNFYPRYPAHYVAKTLHLSMEQDGAYTRLLDWYYANERGIPHAQRYAIARAQTPSERRSTDAVLDQFFTQENGVWANGRSDDEIATAQPKIKAARENGRLGGRPKKNPPGSDQKPTGFSTETHNEPSAKAPQSPIPNTPSGTYTALPAFRATDAGRACLLMRQAGCGSTNPSHPDLLAAIAEGVEPETLADTAREAVESGKAKPFAWAITTARSRRAEGPRPITGEAHGTRRESVAERTRRLAVEGDIRDQATAAAESGCADAVGAHG
jgi:uncharacterized protein YdaU (DUF1376 family)